MDHKWRPIMFADKRGVVFWCQNCGTVKDERSKCPLFYIPGKGTVPNSDVCANQTKIVEDALVELQRRAASNEGGVV